MATAVGRDQSLDLNLYIFRILHYFDLPRINAFIDYISTCLIYATMHFYLEEKSIRNIIHQHLLCFQARVFLQEHLLLRGLLWVGKVFSGWVVQPPIMYTTPDCYFVNRDRGKKTAVHNLSVTVCEISEHCPSFTEHVVLQVEYMSYYDSLVELQVCAPSKTCSDILTARTVNHIIRKKRIKRERKWNFMTLQFWGENPNGIWKLKMRQSVRGIYTVGLQWLEHFWTMKILLWNG